MGNGINMVPPNKNIGNAEWGFEVTKGVGQGTGEGKVSVANAAFP